MPKLIYLFVKKSSKMARGLANNKPLHDSGDDKPTILSFPFG
jgi:hypothetical protein